MTETPADHERILLALDVLEGETISEDLVRFIGPTDVELVGYHELPEQTAPSQMRHQFEEQAERILDDIAAEITAVGGTVEQRLVFTHDLEQSLSRIRAESEATGELLPNPTAPVEAMLVPVLGEIDPARLAAFIVNLRGDRDVDITLLGPTTDEEETTTRELVTTIRDNLRDAGVDPAAITMDITVTEQPHETIVDGAVDHQVTVIPERVPDWRTVIFGDLEDRIAQESLGPVFVVYPSEDLEPAA